MIMLAAIALLFYNRAGFFPLQWYFGMY